MAEIDKITCIKHGGNPIVLSNFYISGRESIFGGIGYIPICKDCLYDMTTNYYNIYKDMKLSIYYMCRKIDVAFNSNIFEAALGKGLEKDEDIPKKVFQSYITQYNSLGRKNNVFLPFDDGEHIGEVVATTYDESVINSIDENNIISVIKKDVNIADIDLETQIFWGFGFDPKDYVFLETEIANWKQTHKCDNQAEITLLKEICIKILEIRRLREVKKSVAKEQKELQDLMKTASVDPAKANVADGGKTLDAFGSWIKDIEQNEPAEFFEDKKLYQDFDGIKKYTDKYIFRPLKNLITGSRDFNIQNDVESDTQDEQEDGDE